jgi:fructokinase
MKVLAFGEILFDIIEGKHYLGGAPLNFAGHLARMGADFYIFSNRKG